MGRDTKDAGGRDPVAGEQGGSGEAPAQAPFGPGFRAFYERHFRFAWRLVARLAADSADVEDLVQEVFTIAGRKLPEFEGRARETTWLYRICTNVVVADRRKKRRQHLLGLKWLRPDPSDALADGPDRDVERQDAQTLVREILGGMTARKRDVFVLFELEGLSGQEVAQMVGCPLDTMWTRLFHARRDFRKALAQRGFHELADLDPVLGVGR